MPTTVHAYVNYPQQKDDALSVPAAGTEMAQVIAISSGKGGVGKSTLSSNLAIALSQAGKRVCLVDADTNLANINILLGITPLHTLEHFLTQDLTLRDIIIKGPEGMDIIAGASGVSDFVHLSRAQQEKMIVGIRSLERDYQFLLLDTAAGISATNINLILAAPYLILGITQEPTSLTDAFSLLRVLQQQQFNRPVLVIVNMASSLRSAQATFQRFKKAVKKYLKLKVYFVGHVLNDKNVPKSVLKQRAIVLLSPQSAASKCIFKISKRLLSAFRKRPAATTALSDHLAETAFLEEISKQLEAQESIPDHGPFEQEQPEARAEQQPGTEELTARSGLLKASYFARLLAARK